MQAEVVGDAVGKFLLIVRNHDKRLVRPLAEALDDLADKLPVLVVEAVKRFVEDEQLRVFHKGSSQETEALLTTAELQERPVCHFFYAEDTHPIKAHLLLLWLRTNIKPYRVTQPARYHIDSRNVFKVSSMHLRADITDVFLDLPDAFTGATSVSEEFDIAGVGLGIVGTNQA